MRCVDRAAGVLRHTCCRDGQRMARRDKCGRWTQPHFRYSRRAVDNIHVHQVKGKPYIKIRIEISKLIAEQVDL